MGVLNIIVRRNRGWDNISCVRRWWWRRRRRRSRRRWCVPVRLSQNARSTHEQDYQPIRDTGSEETQERVRECTAPCSFEPNYTNKRAAPRRRQRRRHETPPGKVWEGGEELEDGEPPTARFKVKNSKLNDTVDALLLLSANKFQVIVRENATRRRYLLTAPRVHVLSNIYFPPRSPLRWKYIGAERVSARAACTHNVSPAKWNRKVDTTTTIVFGLCARALEYTPQLLERASLTRRPCTHTSTLQNTVPPRFSSSNSQRAHTHFHHAVKFGYAQIDVYDRAAATTSSSLLSLYIIYPSKRLRS